jgi:hypothetical protein
MPKFTEKRFSFRLAFSKLHPPVTGKYSKKGTGSIRVGWRC